jgi:CheY-like chemotaxis protein
MGTHDHAGAPPAATPSRVRPSPAPAALGIVVRLLHWNAARAATRAVRLRAAGYEVDARTPSGAATLRALRASPPAAVLIDLSQAAAQGLEMATALRWSKATRHVPILFVEGAPESIAQTKRALPEATCTTWRQIRSALRQALARPPVRRPNAPGSGAARARGSNRRTAPE